MAKKIFPISLIFAAALFLYHPVLSIYFSGDDFFHFKVALAGKSVGFYPFEKYGIAFWRPIFREILYGTFYKLFGLNHLPFRVLQLVIHLTNITLVYLLIQKLFGKKDLSFFTAFFFGISAANVGALYYLAGGVQAQGATCFMLLTLLFWPERKALSFVAFVLALASHELAVITPLLLAGLVFISKKKFKPKDCYQFIPHLLLVGLYLYLNIFAIGFSSSESAYQLNFSPKALVNTYAWYASWAMGLPEMTVDYVGAGLKLNPNLMAFWGNYYRIIFPTFFISIILTSYFIIQNLKNLKNKKILFLVFWFLVALLPVAFLPIHKKTYYLQPALPAFWGAAGYLLFSIKKKYLVVLFLICALVIQISSVRLADKTYWAANRGRIAEKLINQVKEKYQELPKGAAIYFKNDPDYPTLSGDWQGSSKQAFFALNGADALQLLYHDPTLQVYYEDVDKVPDGFEEDKIFSLIAELN